MSYMKRKLTSSLSTNLQKNCSIFLLLQTRSRILRSSNVYRGVEKSIVTLKPPKEVLLQGFCLGQSERPILVEHALQQGHNTDFAQTRNLGNHVYNKPRSEDGQNVSEEDHGQLTRNVLPLRTYHVS